MKQFAITRKQCKVVSVNPFAERQGNSGKHEPGMSITVLMVLTPDHVDELSPELRRAFYKKARKGKKEAKQPEQADLVSDVLSDTSDLLEPKFGKKLDKFPWNDELSNYTLTLSAGLTDSEEFVERGCKVHNFVLAPMEGAVQLKCSIGFHPNIPHAGWFAHQVSQMLLISLEPPARQGDIEDKRTTEEAVIAAFNDNEDLGEVDSTDLDESE